MTRSQGRIFQHQIKLFYLIPLIECITVCVEARGGRGYGKMVGVGFMPKTTWTIDESVVC